MRVRVTYKTWNDIQTEETYYSQSVNDVVADQIVDSLVDAINRLHVNQSGKRVERMPRSYWRVSVTPFHLYYRFSRDKSYVLVFLLRYQKRRPLSPSTLKRLASEGEHDSFEF